MLQYVADAVARRWLHAHEEAQMRCAGGECRRTKGFVIVHQVVDWTGQDRTIESHVLGACP